MRNRGVLEIRCQFFILAHNTMRRIDNDRGFNFEEALKAIQSGQAISGKDGVPGALVKPLMEAAHFALGSSLSVVLDAPFVKIDLKLIDGLMAFLAQCPLSHFFVPDSINHRKEPQMLHF